MKKSVFSVLALVIAVCFTVQAFAATFPDVPEDKYSWASEAIKTMSDDGIIKGYEDGSFGPERTVTKLEALVLISRILGVNDKTNSEFVKNAEYLYEDKINSYDLPYGEKEISYLVAKGVIVTDELEDYISKTNYSIGLKRYEVAVLLTKAMDGDKKMDSALTVLDYADASDIPSYARKYVQFVTDKGLMQGMEKDKFVPNYDVTRAQAAVVLYKLKNLTNYEFQFGTVSSVDTSSKIIKIKNSDGDTFANTVLTDTIIRKDGTEISIGDISVGMNAYVTYSNTSLYAIDVSDPLIDDVVYGSFVGYASNTKDGNTINIYVLGEDDTELSNDNKQSYKLADNFVVTYNGSSAAISDLKSGYYVALTVKSGKVTSVAAQDKNRTVTGSISAVTASPKFKIQITTKDGDTEEYLVGNNVTISKNGSNVSGESLFIGDNVALTLTYDRVSKVVATSKTAKKSGIISEIVISNNPKITVTIDDKPVTFALTNDVEIDINGTKGTIYDLRNGVAATLTVESDTVTKITTTTSSATTTQITGKVESVNATLNLIQISYVDSTLGTTRSDPVYVSKATILDTASGKTKKIADVKTGSTVTVIGSVNTGVFVATTVVIVE